MIDRMARAPWIRKLTTPQIVRSLDNPFRPSHGEKDRAASLEGFVIPQTNLTAPGKVLGDWDCRRESRLRWRQFRVDSVPFMPGLPRAPARLHRRFDHLLRAPPACRCIPDIGEQCSRR